MKYDVLSNGWSSLIQTFDLSCAFKQVREEFSRLHNVGGHWDERFGGWGGMVGQRRETNEEHEDRLWGYLCEILVASETRPVFISTTDREQKMKDLLSACPYVTQVAEAPSRQGRYRVQIWVVNQHERNV